MRWLCLESSKARRPRAAHCIVQGVQSAAVLCLALTGCASVSRAPDRADIAELVLIDYSCDVPGSAECKVDEQPREVIVDDLDCQPLPLKAGVPEVSRAKCSYSATLVRADGKERRLDPVTAEFGLLNYSPGARIGVYQWSKKTEKAAVQDAQASK